MAWKVFGEAEKLARQLVPEVRVVYDVGACRGLWTSKYEMIWPTAQFFLFDVERKGNDPKRQDHTWVLGALAAPGQGEVEFYRRKGGASGDSYYREMTRHYDGVSPWRIPTRTIDSLDLPDPQVIKLDTQGSEIDILRGATRALESALLIQVEMPITPYNEGAPTFDDYVAFLGQHGFIPTRLEEIHYMGARITQVDVVFVAERIAERFALRGWQGRVCEGGRS